MGMLSHHEMKSAILSKGVVMLPNGRIIDRVEDLPTDADVARHSGDPIKIQSAEDEIDRQIKALQDAKAKLKDSPAPATPAAEEVPKPEAPKAPPLGPSRVPPATVTVAPTAPPKPASK